MDPITLLGVIGSVASVISLFRTSGRNITVNAVASEVAVSLIAIGSGSGATRRVPIGEAVSEEELRDTVKTLIAIADTDKAFLDRILRKCLKPYKDAIDDDNVDETDLEEAKQIARQCVCSNIRMARKAGRFPSPAFKKLWAEFECGNL